MEKIAAPLVALVSVFLYFTHDAGFNFEAAKEDKRMEFAQRQAHAAAGHAGLVVRGEEGAVFVSRDQMLVRLKIRADGALNFSRHQAGMMQGACTGYLESYLDEHAIALRFEFYRDTGTMAGTLSLSPSACAVYATQAG